MANETSGAGRRELDDHDARLPLHVRLRDVLTSRIRSGEWSPAHPLPAETTLAEHYGVAMGTMRKVLGELVADGLLERRQGAGTFVRRAKLDSSLFRFFRYGKENQVAPASRILSFDHATLPADAAAGLDAEPGSPALHLHRIRLREDHPLLLEDIWLPLPAFAALADVDPDDFGDLLYPAYEQRCGIVVARAEEVLTVRKAAAGEALLLRCKKNDPLVVVERTARAHDGSAVEWRRSRGGADDFRYRVEIR